LGQVIDPTSHEILREEQWQAVNIHAGQRHSENSKSPVLAFWRNIGGE
jgi:hypothetical protein